ncbi:Putative Flp pilus-assembly TadE/G-like [Rhizobium sp. RU20A]|uniref:TadE/TadG family type IV pilus assembly protein n=1 Tax=Rhizobium sp. RU20A TaxID=1907412 RepID=UPI0009544710|nr:TadE/TadG family type IV pilus assembly protein [Rhizobium sp. RU20A]SIQ09979.1 Putative Flp pilus-assembly TadE/G-like [Rhizobium sp. RU20A]
MSLTFSNFWKDRGGNFAMLFALTAVPVVGAAGLSVDFARVLKAQYDLRAQADTAALGVLAANSETVKAAMAMKGDGIVAVGSDAMARLAKGQRDDKPDELGQQIMPFTGTVTKNGRTLTAEISYSLEIPTTLLRILGKDAITVSGTASAQLQTQSFMDFYMLLDNTPSMGVGATPADIDKLVNATPDQCAFACHIVDNGKDDKNSYYNLARKIGATIRIDVVAQATASLMDEAKAQMQFAQQFRMAAYTFGEKAEDLKLQKVASLTSNLTSVKKKTDSIKLMSIPYQGYDNDQQTSFDNALTKISAEIGKPGTGASTSDREKIVFFVSDGVGDSYKPSTCTKKTTGGRCQEPIDITYCKALKDRGIRIAVLYTTYLPLPTNGWYNDWIKPFQGEIAGRMEACASPGLFFEVSPTEGIDAAMKALFHRVIQSPHLTT